MEGIIAFFISYLTGYLVLKCFKDKNDKFSLTDIFVAVGLGLGISAQIVFYTLLLIGRIDPVWVIGVHLICLCALFFFSFRYTSLIPSVISCEYWQATVFFIILSLTAAIAIVLALTRPWGDWDGWSYWNYQANFLFRSGYGWHRVFDFNMQAHHPWMLPLMIVWGWSFLGKEQTIVPMAIGVIFTISTVGLLIGALKKYVPFVWALTAGLFLSSIPVYGWQGTSQYADIEAAYFILLSCVLAVDLLKSPSAKPAAFTGLCLGLSAGIKDNSLVASILLLILITIHLYKESGLRFIRPLIGGFIVSALAMILMKSLDTSWFHNHSYDASLSALWDTQKWMLVVQFLLRALTNFMWGGVWILGLVVVAVGQSHLRNKPEGKVVQFLSLYTILYFFIFVASSHKLEWLLSVSFGRLLFILVPTFVFVTFYIIGKKE